MVNKLHKQIIHKRQEAILDLIEQRKDIPRIERELALLVLDVIDAVTRKSLSLKEGCGCFTAIDYAIDKKLRADFSQDFFELLNEAVILDEAGTRYGPNLELMTKLAQDILKRDAELKKSKIKNFVASRA